MTRLFSLFCAALILLTAAVPTAVRASAEESAFQFTREEFPVLDGSTSIVPLGQGIVSVLLGISREDASEMVNFNRTTQSFRNLTAGQCDVVIAAEPKNSVFEEMKDASFAYEMETIAKEALVFVVNENNPVDSLTQQQVRDIYAGKITNWKEVGGEDLPIEAFQRNPTAGSQVMMEKLVMDGTPMMEAPSTHIPTEMGELIEAVKSFDNSANAIGYTVFYYASDMQMAQGLKILRIDNVLPCADTIRAEEYPYLNGYYACISAQAAPDSPARILYDWLLTDAGQSLLTLEGYVSVYAPGEAPESGTNVAVDYTHYVPNSGTPAKFTPIEGDLNHLSASDSYGLIYPYHGGSLYSSWADEDSDYYAGHTYGFFNRDGMLITNPIYTYINRCSAHYQPGADYIWVVSDGGELSGFVTKDGSSVSDIAYQSISMLGDYIVCRRNWDSPDFELYALDGTLLKTGRDFQIEGSHCYPYDAMEDLFLCTTGWDAEKTLYCVTDFDGTPLLTSEHYIYFDNGFIVEELETSGYRVYRSDLTQAEFNGETVVQNFSALMPNFCEVTLPDDSRIITDRNGSLFEWDYNYVYIHDDYEFEVKRENQRRVYDARGTLILMGEIPDSWEYLGDGCLFQEEGTDKLTIHNYRTGESLVIPHGVRASRYSGIYTIFCTDASYNWYDQLMDSEMNLIDTKIKSLTITRDDVDNTPWIIAQDAYGFYGSQQLLSADGQKVVFQRIGNIQVFDSIISLSSEWAFSAYDMDGNLLFCYPNYGLASGD